MARRTKELRLTQLEEFLREVKSCRGKFSARKKRELGKHFLEVVMGLEDEFIACKVGKYSPDFEPRNKKLYPWALFVTAKDDLQEDCNDRAILYLHSDNVDEKMQAVITNGKELRVFDSATQEKKGYTVVFAEFISGNAKDVKHWKAFLTDFGVESAKERRKKRRKEGIIDIEDRGSRPPSEKLSKLIRGVKQHWNEETLKKDFVFPLCKLAGWQVDSLDGGDKSTEVKVESQVGKGRLDILLKDGGVPRIVIECKKPALTLFNSGGITTKGREAMEQVHKYAKGLRHWQRGHHKEARLPNIMSMVVNGKQVIWFDSSEQDFSNAFRIAKAHEISKEVLSKIWSIINVKEVRSSDLNQVCKHSTIFDERKVIQVSSTHLLSDRVLRWLKEILKGRSVEPSDALAMTLQVLFMTIARDHGILGEEEINKDLGNWDKLFKMCKKRFNSNVFEIKRPSTIKENILDNLYEDSKKLDYRLDAIPVKYVGNIYEDLLRHLNKGNSNFSNTSYYTPDWLVEEIIEQLNPDTNDKIIDPTCGSAAFLTYAFDYVAKYMPFEESKDYLSKNIFGIDCDPLAVQISRFALLVSLAKKVDGNLLGTEHLLPMLTKNIECKDFFNFESKVKFDIAFGNPPWGSIDKEARTKEIKSSLKKFKSYTDKTDICIYVVEKAFNHLSSKGKMGFLVQRTAADEYSEKFERFRDWWGGRIEEVWNFGSKRLFKNTAETAVLLGRVNTKNSINYVDRSGKEKVDHDMEVRGCAFSEFFWCLTGGDPARDYVFKEYAKEYPNDVCVRLLATTETISNGVIKKKKKILFIDPRTADCDIPLNVRKWLKTKKITKKCKGKNGQIKTQTAEKLLKERGQVIRKSKQLSKNGKRNAHTLAWIWFNGYKHYKFDGSQMRIVIPRWLNGKRLKAGLDLRGQFFSLTSTTVLIPKDTTKKAEIFFTLAWLNSKLFSQTEANKTKTTARDGRAMFPNYIKNMSIPDVPMEIRHKIVKLAESGAKYGFTDEDLNELDQLFEKGLRQVKVA